MVIPVGNLDFQVLIKHPHAAARFESEDLFHRRIHDGANEKGHGRRPADRSNRVMEY
jgi:hypothetical protein